MQTCIHMTKARMHAFHDFILIFAALLIHSRPGDANDLSYKLQDVKVDNNSDIMTDSPSFKELRRLKKLEIYPRHRGVAESEHRCQSVELGKPG